jgi:carbamoyl-phosphate synthase small subunit
MQAILALEDGRIFRGESHGAGGERAGEVVFNTSLTGYQEIFTDPSYTGQIVVLTNPQIGNYGTNAADAEAQKPYIEGLVTREFSPVSSNWRSEQVADEYLERHGVPAISEIDTRALVRHLRTYGAMRGVISTKASSTDALVANARALTKMDGTDLASLVSTRDSYEWDRNHAGNAIPGLMPDVPEEKLHVVAYDYGIKHNILRMLTREGCRVTVVPARTPAEDVLSLKPDGIFLSNGPGDPEPLHYAQENIRQLAGKKPIFGICLGHQLLGIAIGARTYKMFQGHRGANHPVKRSADGRVEITSMNHGFAVDAETLPANAEATHVSLFDGSLAGLRLTDRPAFSVQYHPEASPGPQDSHYLFEQFVGALEKGQ